ncbi:MAG: DNA internalization-related competence protein ComEC/Rec2 [Acidobacteria bacterium]|nr:DNA internalization-related competence protein ComEC/Rec2 [Acidobacteriota bacterium]
MKQPLFPLAISLISGIIFARYLPFNPYIFLFLLFFVLFLAIFSFFRGVSWYLFSFILIFFFLAGSLAYYSTLVLPEDHLISLIRKGEIDVKKSYDFSAVVVDEPERAFGKLYLTVELRNIFLREKVIPVRGKGRIIVRFTRWSREEAKEFFYGDVIRTTARFYLPQGRRNRWGFDYREYLHSKGLYFTCYAKSPFAIEIKERGKGSPLLAPFLRLRRFFSRAVERHFVTGRGWLTTEGALIKAMTIGEREMVPHWVERMMRELGIYHLLAISGLHIGIISYFLYFLLLKGFRLSDRISSFVLLIIIVFYALLLPARPSILRASLMAGIYLLGRVIGREGSLLGALSLSAIIVLLIDPRSLFTLGFKLSYLATLSIALLSQRIVPYLRFLPRRFAEITAISLSAQIGVLPILLLYFDIVSPLSFPATLIAFPLVGAIIFGGGIFYLLSIISGSASLVMGVLLSTITSLFLKVVSFLSHYSFAYYLPTPFLFVVAGYYLALVFLLFSKRKKVFLVGFVVFLLLLITYPFPQQASSELNIVFFDVGKGESILIRFPGRKVMLIDGGGSEGDNGATGELTIAPYLFHLGIRRIDYLVASHFHTDHVNGLFPLIERFEIGEFFMGNGPREIINYRRLMKVVARKNIPIRKLKRGDELTIAGVRIEVLNPSPDPYVSLAEENDDSLVFKITMGKVKVLLPADIGGKKERELVALYRDELRSHILKAAHHGAEDSNTEPFLKEVSPRAIVVTGWVKSRGRRLSGVVKDRFQRLPALIKTTGEEGEVDVEIDGVGFWITPYRPKFFDDF